MLTVFGGSLEVLDFTTDTSGVLIPSNLIVNGTSALSNMSITLIVSASTTLVTLHITLNRLSLALCQKTLTPGH